MDSQGLRRHLKPVHTNKDVAQLCLCNRTRSPNQKILRKLRRVDQYIPIYIYRYLHWGILICLFYIYPVLSDDLVPVAHYFHDICRGTLDEHNYIK